MTVSELIDKLKQMPQDMPVIIHADWSSLAAAVFIQKEPLHPAVVISE